MEESIEVDSNGCILSNSSQTKKSAQIIRLEKGR